MFDQIFYSLIRWNFHFQSVKAELERLKTFLAANHIHSVDIVDVGCGDGAITSEIKKLLNTPEIYGIDLNHRLLKMAERRGVRTICKDMSSLSLERRFDLVISYGSLHHIENTDEFIGGLARISKNHILIVDNTVRRTLWHELTRSRYFPLESSSYAIRTVQEIVSGLNKANCLIIDVLTSLNANLWHDRSFFLAAVGPAARLHG